VFNVPASCALRLGLLGGGIMGKLIVQSACLLIGGIQAERGSGRVAGFIEMRFFSKFRSQVDPGLYPPGRSVNGQLKMFNGTGGIAASCQQIAKLLLSGRQLRIEFDGLLQLSALAFEVSGLMERDR
jgi:hypothetical protein